MKATDSTDFKGDKEHLPPAISTPLNMLTLYNSRTFPTLSISQLRSPLELQVSKIQPKNKYNDQELLLIVLNNHVRAIIDLK